MRPANVEMVSDNDYPTMYPVNYRNSLSHQGTTKNATLLSDNLFKGDSTQVTADG